jgi:hypothetical protein
MTILRALFAFGVLIVFAVVLISRGDPLLFGAVRSFVADTVRLSGALNTGDTAINQRLNGRQLLVLMKAQGDMRYNCTIMRTVMGPSFKCSGVALVDQDWDAHLAKADLFIGRNQPERDMKAVVTTLLELNQDMTAEIDRTLDTQKQVEVAAAALNESPPIAEAENAKGPTPEEIAKQDEQAREAQEVQKALDLANADYDYFQARFQKSCIPGSSSYENIGRTGVRCGCDYTSWATSTDGRRVCAGGEYTSWATSTDGSDVACGGRYTSWSTSRDGKRVCAGGEYTSWATSTDGSDVACGGRYTSWSTSRDGRRVCAGGEYTSWASSTDGSDVACGGRYTSSASSRDGKLTCYGGAR